MGIKTRITNYLGNKPSQLLMFYSMVVIETLAMLAIAVLQILMNYETDSAFPMFASIIYLLVIFLLANIYPKHLSVYKILTMLPMILLFIPYLYMGTEGGGVQSGMPIWMVLGLLMVFLFTKGICFWIFITVTLSVYMGCIVYSYLFLQDKLGQLEELYYYQDNVMAILAVSISCGMIIKYHQKIEARSLQKIEQEKRKAQSANESKSKFLTNMSHDIRTPMNAIIGMTEMAMYHIDDQDKVKDCLRKISDSSTMLLHLINNVLDMSEIEHNEMKLRDSSFELLEVIEKVSTVMEQVALNKRLTFEVKSERIDNNYLIGDFVRLKQVIINLVSNSLKFTPAGGRVSLEVTQEGVTEDGYACFIIQVKDTGIGMKQEFIDTVLFDSFARDETNYVNKTEGNGIGMSITKSILDEMGANLHVESEVGKGTTFCIHLKLKIDTSEVKEQEDEQEKKIPDLQNKKILVVEDNDINMEIIVSILERTNAQIVSVWNAEDAIEEFGKSAMREFDLLLFDIQLPGMNGYEAVKIIRAMEREDVKTIPIFAMTANAFAQDVEQSMVSGMNEHISKPIDIDVLYQKIQTYLLK